MAGMRPRRTAALGQMPATTVPDATDRRCRELKTCRRLRLYSGALHLRFAALCRGRGRCGPAAANRPAGRRRGLPDEPPTWSTYVSGSMNDSDRTFVHQFAKLIGGLAVLTVVLIL